MAQTNYNLDTLDTYIIFNDNWPLNRHRLVMLLDPRHD